jgi:hypothetical protein
MVKSDYPVLHTPNSKGASVISRNTDVLLVLLLTDYCLLKRAAPQQALVVLAGCCYLACSAVPCSAVRCSAVGERHSVVDSFVDRLAELLGKESHSAHPWVHPSARLSGEPAGDGLHGLAVVAVQKNS